MDAKLRNPGRSVVMRTASLVESLGGHHTGATWPSFELLEPRRCLST
ncbi:hypothetical protein ACFPRL_22785 [Pseudoclavibacter helvolus]